MMLAAIKPFAKPGCCPTCQRPYPPQVQISGPIRQAIFNYIAKHPQGVTLDQVFDAVYASCPNGGPSSRNVISVHVKNINDRLKGTGIYIRGSGGPGSVYKLYGKN